MSDNFLMGDNELVIVYQNSTYQVLEKNENWDWICCGSYRACREYCEARQKEYTENVVE